MYQFKKSSISLSTNTSTACKNEICGLLGVTGTSDHGLYLGLPLMIGRNKKDVFSFIVDKVWNCLQS